MMIKREGQKYLVKLSDKETGDVIWCLQTAQRIVLDKSDLMHIVRKYSFTLEGPQIDHFLRCLMAGRDAAARQRDEATKLQVSDHAAFWADKVRRIEHMLGSLENQLASDGAGR